MENVIAEYQKWKQQGETLKAQARQAMENRFRDLLIEAARIAQEYTRDFGGTLKAPPPVTAFRFKAAVNKTARKAAKKAVGKTGALPVKSAALPDPKVAALEKKLALTRTKMEAARAAGKPVKNFEDRIYEIEDEIRLASQG
jgi:hypothetical protein